MTRPLMILGTAVVAAAGARSPRSRPICRSSPSCGTRPRSTRRRRDTFKANFDTSKGTFVIEVHRDWAPLGADRFYNLVKNGFYDDVRFFRVIAGFMAQFGIHGNPADRERLDGARSSRTIRSKQSNKRGFITFAHRADRTRGRRRSSSTSGTTRASTSRASRRSAK